MNLFPIWVLAVFLNTIMQELLVRGYLYQMLKQKHSIIAAAVVTTILFTALHGGAFETGVIPVLNVLTMSLLMTIPICLSQLLPETIFYPAEVENKHHTSNHNILKYVLDWQLYGL